MCAWYIPARHIIFKRCPGIYYGAPQTVYKRCFKILPVVICAMFCRAYQPVVRSSLYERNSLLAVAYFALVTAANLSRGVFCFDFSTSGECFHISRPG